VHQKLGDLPRFILRCTVEQSSRYSTFSVWKISCWNFWVLATTNPKGELTVRICSLCQRYFIPFPKFSKLQRSCQIMKTSFFVYVELRSVSADTLQWAVGTAAGGTLLHIRLLLVKWRFHKVRGECAFALDVRRAPAFALVSGSHQEFGRVFRNLHHKDRRGHITENGQRNENA